MNRNSYLSACLVFATLGLTGIASGADTLPAAVTAKLKAYYGNAPTEALQGWDANGVKVYHVGVTTKDGKTDAALTDNGDILWAGSPVATGSLPAKVSYAANGLFQTPPQSIEMVDRTYVSVEISSGKFGYELQFDPTGKLTHIHSNAQVSPVSYSKSDQETSPDVRQMLMTAAQKAYPGTTVTDVFHFPNTPGYDGLIVQKAGQQGWLIVDQKGSFVSTHVPATRTQLPAGVRKTLDAEFKSENIKGVYNDEERFYHVVQKVGTATVSMDIRPNGDVFNFESK